MNPRARVDVEALSAALAPVSAVEETRRAYARNLGKLSAPTRQAIAHALLGGASTNGTHPEEEDRDPTFLTLRELLARPELLIPPEAVAAHLAYRARLVALCGPDKSGKSTLAAHVAAAVTHEHPVLGAPTSVRYGRVVWIGLEEALGDAVRRFHELGAHPDRTKLVVLSETDVLERARELLADWPADLVVIDSLTEYARVTEGKVPDEGDAGGWAAVVRPLVALARDHDVAVLLLHHVRKSDGVYRGSGEIAAAVDALLEMVPPLPTEDPTLRKIRGRARWPFEPFAVALRDGRYELEGGAELSLDVRLLLHIEASPGVSMAQLRKVGGVRATKVDAAVGQLEARGAIERRGSGYHSTAQSPRMEGL